MIRRFKLAAVASHPVQYQAPWFRALAGMVDLRVFFAHRATARDQSRAGFDVEFDWDVPLRDGYASEFLTNHASRPAVDRFFGTDTPDLHAAVIDGAFDAVIVNGWQLRCYWQAVHAAHRAGVPVLVRGDSQLDASPRGWRRAVKRVAYPRMLRAFDGYLAVGERSAAYYRAYGAAAARIFRSPHCVDNELFARLAAAARPRRAAIRCALGIPADAVVFGFAGRLVEQKRLGDFLRALGAGAGDREWVHGLVIGDGPCRAALEHEAAASGTRCRFAGFVNQASMADAYVAMDALVLPSDARETWGLVVNEAMACGVPAIVSDAVGCAPDLVSDGETGFRYRCGDVAALAARLRTLADSARLRESIGRAARDRVDRYSPREAAAGVLRALHALQPRATATRAETAVIDRAS